MAPNLIYEHLWEEEEEEEEEEESEDDAEITLDSIKKSKTINFSIRASYTRWAPREAFRELVQNWRDGIIKAFDLAEKDFCVVRKTRTSGSDTEIIYQVSRAGADDTKEWLGYIRYKGRNGEGTIDITNRSATLQPWHLDLGGTSKAGDDHQAGAHGEGLKLALLVLMRGKQNHSVRCRSGGFNWKFNFTTYGRLVARLHRMSSEAIQRAESQFQRSSRRSLLPFGSNPERDVQFVIGETHMGRDQWGDKVKRSPVKQEDFEAWTKAALFLQNGEDGGIISTDTGDLLTADGLRGHIYLKGLLLRESVPTWSASITNQPLKFGYNFAFGHTNRERQSVASADEEARAILAIWSKAVKDKPDLVRELSEMLNTAEPKYADIAGAERLMDIETARLLKEYLVGSEFSGKWYYCSEDKNKNPRLDHIIQGLGCEGVQLTDLYWAILRRHNLLRTAEEEEHRRFTTAPPVAAAELETAFAQSVHRLLRACVHACPKTDGIAIQFVQAGQLHLQLFYSEAEWLFRVHERWLSLDGAIEELGLPDDLPHADAVFHTVKRLFADALEQLPCEMFAEDGSRTTEWRRKLEVSLAEQRLLYYQRVGGLYVWQRGSDRDLRLTWELESRLDYFHTRVEIQCHSASRCLHLRESLLTAEDAQPENLMCMTFRNRDDLEQRSCNTELLDSQFPTCRSHECDYLEGRHYELDLEAGEEYFFVLRMPAKPDSFVALSSVAGVAHPALSPSPARSRPPSQVFHHGPRKSAPQAWPSDLPSPQRSGPSDSSSADRSRLVDNGTVSIRDASPSPEPNFSERRPPTEETLGATPPSVVTAPAPATATAPAPATTTAPAPATTTAPASATATAPASATATAPAPAPATVPAGSFTLGPRLDALDVFELAKGQWYEARNAENVQAVIGILRGEMSLPEETRKRRRID